MHTRMANDADVESWAELRAMLWPSASLEEHRVDIGRILENSEQAGFVARNKKGETIGFAEAALRRDYVNGCSTSPVAFLEGILVTSSYRNAGIGRSLCDAVAVWAGSKGCTELASDSHVDNTGAHAFHLAAGFEESERVIYYRKSL